MGGDIETLAATLRSHQVLLAAHGPYTAAGVAETLGVSVGCVSKDFSSFDGEAPLVHCDCDSHPALTHRAWCALTTWSMLTVRRKLASHRPVAHMTWVCAATGQLHHFLLASHPARCNASCAVFELDHRLKHIWRLLRAGLVAALAEHYQQ